MIHTKVIETRLMPESKFIAITLFGLVFTRDRRLITPRVLRHELIHCRQQLEWLYVPFFILYLVEWIIGLIKHRANYSAYRNISFEREAYSHEHDESYLSRRCPYANYRKNAKDC